MDPQKFSGGNPGPGDIPTALQLEMMMTLPAVVPVHTHQCQWEDCRFQALWLVGLTPWCSDAHKEYACQKHADAVEAIVARASADPDSTLYCRYCLSRKTGITKEPIR